MKPYVKQGVRLQWWDDLGKSRQYKKQRRQQLKKKLRKEVDENH